MVILFLSPFQDICKGKECEIEYEIEIEVSISIEIEIEIDYYLFEDIECDEVLAIAFSLHAFLATKIVAADPDFLKQNPLL